jgi:hypothetical protein
MIGSIVEDRYLVEEELGNGAMGRVFAARHVKVGRRVAIKIMHDELAKNAAIVERFAREAMVAARLRHPNLVSVLDVGQTPSRQPLLVLELAPGYGTVASARLHGGEAALRTCLAGMAAWRAAGSPGPSALELTVDRDRDRTGWSLPYPTPDGAATMVRGAHRWTLRYRAA